MQLRTLGRSGLKVSAIGLGANTFGGTADRDATVEIVHRALDLGVTFIDTADAYARGRSEEYLGEALAGRRREAVLATKCGVAMSESPLERGTSRRWVMQAIEDSLRRLRTDYVDLYQVHLPDSETPIEETTRALDDVVRQGKARYVGCSNYKAWQLAHALGTARQHGLASWISAQNRWNVIDGLDDPHLLPACRELGVGLIPYTPLASGILTGKYELGAEPAVGTRMGDMPNVRGRLTDAKVAAVERLKPWAEARGHTTTELAIAYLLAHQEVSTVIVGARRASQLDANVTAADWVLTPEERDEVAVLAQAG